MPNRYNTKRNRRSRRQVMRKKQQHFNNNDQYVVCPNANRFSNVVLTPDRMFIKMRFAYIVRVSGTVAQQYVFCGNSIYDPDPAIGGASAEGFNQWMAFYQFYRVHNSSIRVDVTPDYTGASPNYSNIRAIVVPSTTATWTLSPMAASCSRFARKGHIAWTGKGLATITNRMSTCKLLGLRSNEGDMYSLSGTSSSNPTILWYWHILFDGMNGSSSDVKVISEHVITYSVELWKRKDTIELSVPVVDLHNGEIVSTVKKYDKV